VVFGLRNNFGFCGWVFRMLEELVVLAIRSFERVFVIPTVSGCVVLRYSDSGWFVAVQE
jgi:hypothetical protein